MLCAFSLVLGVAIVQAENSQPVNINTATTKELKTVPGIGKVIAERIVEYREKVHLFAAVDGLLNVKGIGAATLEKIRPYVTVEDATH